MDAGHFIKRLQLEPHPEGGYFRQLYGNEGAEKKDVSTIYYLLQADDVSAFHRLHGMTEIWYYHTGERLNIYVINDDGELTVHHLFPNNQMQVVIQPEMWFAAEIPTKTGFTLVGCAVAPAFDFKNFELGDKESLLKQFPQHAELIERLC